MITLDLNKELALKFYRNHSPIVRLLYKQHAKFRLQANLKMLFVFRTISPSSYPDDVRILSPRKKGGRYA